MRVRILTAAFEGRELEACGLRFLGDLLVVYICGTRRGVFVTISVGFTYFPCPYYTLLLKTPAMYTNLHTFPTPSQLAISKYQQPLYSTLPTLLTRNRIKLSKCKLHQRTKCATRGRDEREGVRERGEGEREGASDGIICII